MSESDFDRPSMMPPSESRLFSEQERRFLCGLLDKLAEDDRSAYDALLAADPEWVEHYGASEHLRQRIRAALTGQSGVRLSSRQERLIERTKAQWATYRAGGYRTAIGGVADESTGILTSVTRKIAPERALELYREIAPGFVYQVLERLNQSASLGVVRELVDHLCSEEVQARLRACRHVRDGILDELRTVLGRSEIHQEISLANLQSLLEKSGAMNNLIALENCIKLAATRAG